MSEIVPDLPPHVCLIFLVKLAKHQINYGYGPG